MRKYAFTLAEALITLAIIGVIAAITIPSVVANHQKKQLETSFAKAYRTFSQAVNLAVAEHGGIEAWPWKEEYTYEEKNEFVKTYITPYLNVVKYCPAGEVTECIPQVKYEFLDGSVALNTIGNNSHPTFVLADGSCALAMLRNNHTKAKDVAFDIWVDTNCHKKPQVSGADLHIFGFYPQTGEFLPYGVNKHKSYDEATKSFAKNSYEAIVNMCGGSGRGDSCSARIVMDGFKINYDR